MCLCLIWFVLGGCGKHAGPSGESEITVVSYGGGAYQESHKKYFCSPFTELTGTKVNSVVWSADYPKLRSMVDSGKVTWDVVEVTAAQFARGNSERLYEDLSVTPRDGSFLENTVLKNGVANVYWGTVMAFKRSSFPAESPQTWADFWNTDKFPGSRALYDDPRGNLEFALLADGVSRQKLYPLDVDRAFKKLEQIKPHIRVWWSDGSQPVQVLLNGTVVLSAAWNGRIFASEQARKEIGYSWDGAALELDYWVVPRGSPNRDAASRFIAFASSPYALARQSEMIGYGPVNMTALEFVRPEVRSSLPTFPDNWNVSFVVDATWWAANEESVKTRWLAWKSH
jgi:putative spermidine/putrescine transport system substrate-binding protein